MRKFKFRWNYLDQYKVKKQLSFEEMVQQFLKESKEIQTALKQRRMKKEGVYDKWKIK